MFIEYTQYSFGRETLRKQNLQDYIEEKIRDKKFEEGLILQAKILSRLINVLAEKYGWSVEEIEEIIGYEIQLPPNCKLDLGSTF